MQTILIHISTLVVCVFLAAFSREQLTALMDLAESGTGELVTAQKAATWR